MKKINALSSAALSSAALALAGCATMQVPPDRLASEQASVKSAQELGGDNVPDAQLHIDQAKDETETARKLAESGDDRSATMMARAQADADLAVALAREASVRADADRADADLKAIEAQGSL